MKPRVVLADDHVMVAEGLGRLISEVADLVGKASNGRQLVEVVEELAPEIVLSDIDMPIMSGLDALRRLRSRGFRGYFILLTVHADPHLAVEAMREGASGYLVKAAAGDELFDAIRANLKGHIYLSPHVTKDVMRTLLHPTDSKSRCLTARQREILQLITQGRRMKEIAAQMKISVRTAEDHKAQLLASLDVKTTADLVKFAIKHGLTSD